MRPIFIIAGIALVIGCANQSYQADIPTKEQLSEIVITCSLEKQWPPGSRTLRVNDTSRVNAIQGALHAIADSWKSWGPTTLPAAQVTIELVSSNGKATSLSSNYDFFMVWNRTGFRQLSDSERTLLVTTIPRC
jgi:hypothetical protein